MKPVSLEVWAGECRRSAPQLQARVHIRLRLAGGYLAVGLSARLRQIKLRRRARQNAELVAQAARQSEAFLEEKQDRQEKLIQCQERVAELEERLRFARLRYDELRQALTSGNHQGQELA